MMANSDLQIAVSLIDLERVDPLIRSCLGLFASSAGGKLEESGVIDGEPGHFDEMGVVFTCDPLVAACTLDTMRTKDARVGRYPTRCYVRYGDGAWSKLAGNAILVVSEGEDKPLVLNPAVFRIKVEPVKATPPPKTHKPLTFARRNK